MAHFLLVVAKLEERFLRLSQSRRHLAAGISSPSKYSLLSLRRFCRRQYLFRADTSSGHREEVAVSHRW